MNAVDTNILVYAIDAAEPDKSRRAVELIRELAAAETPLVVPWQVAGEFLACLRRWEDGGRIKRADTEAYFQRFLATLPIVQPTTAVLRLALDLGSRFSVSHWDSMLLAACIEAGIETLFSEDLTNGAKYDVVKVVNPFLMA